MDFNLSMKKKMAHSFEETEKRLKIRNLKSIKHRFYPIPNKETPYI